MSKLTYSLVAIAATAFTSGVLLTAATPKTTAQPPARSETTSESSSISNESMSSALTSVSRATVRSHLRRPRPETNEATAKETIEEKTIPLTGEVRGVAAEPKEKISPPPPPTAASFAPTTPNITPPSTPVSKAETKATSVFTQLIHSLTNDARMSAQLPPLNFDENLAQMAQARSQDMIDHRYFSHTAPDGCDLHCRFENADYATYTWGENIAEFSGYTPGEMSTIAQMFVADWLKSRGHRENMLSDTFTHEGVGYAIEDERIVVTVIFARPN